MVFLLRRFMTGRKKSTLYGLIPFKTALTSVTVDDLHQGPHCPIPKSIDLIIQCTC